MNLKMLVLFVGLALAISAGAQQLNPGFISIDCGATSDYVDEDLKIHYQTDEGFVSTGTNMQLSTLERDPDSSGNRKQFQTLRVFPKGTRNCYKLTPKQGKGNTYFIRASFRYGNYDGKNWAPSFDVHIDVNHWATVAVYNFGAAEIIYVPPRDDIEVCLVNTGSGIPFISVLELRLLDNATYRFNSGALLIGARIYYNGNNSTRIRHPDDEYDRLWFGRDESRSNHIITANYNTSVVNFRNEAYKVPEVVLKTALQSQNTSTPLVEQWSSTLMQKWHLYLHFAELQVLGQNQVREFEVSVFGKVVSTLRPQFGKPVTLFNSFPASSNNFNFTVKSTTQSDLPPILNAVEIMSNIDLPNTLTALDDINAMNEVKKAYNMMKDSWVGDPCVPEDYIWEGVSCSYGSPQRVISLSQRVISLNLSSNMLTGDIARATSLSNLLALQILDLSHNQLNGQLPEFLGKLPNLKVIDLTGNNLSGSIPEIIQKKIIDKSLKLSVTDNPHICTTTPCQPRKVKKKNNNAFMTPLLASIATFAALLLIVFAILRRVRDRKGNGQSGGTIIKSKNRAFTYNEVINITANFKTIIGEGGFGKVYLGTLANGIKVAVKMLSKSSKQGFNEFQSEAELLIVVHHRNLVSLVGYCDDSQNMALIYEFMARGNLREHLSESNLNVLTWTERLRVALDITQGLDYLHNGCKPPIIHRDLKTPNILINERMQAKIADFGLSKVFMEENDSHISTRPAGTPGYFDPALRGTTNLNRKSDVYSFGVILLELVTGHPPIMRTPEGYIHIVQWVTPIIESGDIHGIVDPRLKGQFNMSSAWKVVEVAMSCVPGTAIQRPDISQVMSELKECWDMETAVGGSQRLMGSNMGRPVMVGNSLEVASAVLDDDSILMPR